jgi:transposase
VFSNRRVVHQQLAGHEHVAVVIDGVGGRLGELCIPANGGGYQGLLDWTASLGRLHAFGVEGTGSYGIGLARSCAATSRR